jgi:lipid II:glycine glycyltransferase (peptidoglycan interpeptide bridge formation enzyme)
MINYIKRKDLDLIKYDACIENSIQSRIYAFSWYLDIVADHWDVLVLEDYKAVMPITWRKKFGFKYATQPYLCQQLGVFSEQKLSKEIQEKLIESIPRKFIKVSLNYNSSNILSNKMIQKKNYILGLNDTYINLFKSFSKGRKHAVKVGEKKGLVLKPISILSLIKIQEEFYNYTSFSKEKLAALSKFSLENNKGIILGVFKEGTLIGGAFFVQTKKRITYLFSAFSDDGKKLQASSFLISKIIKEYENSNLILDFEGGNMTNIGSFYKSFGAEIEMYYFFSRKLFKS